MDVDAVEGDGVGRPGRVLVGLKFMFVASRGGDGATVGLVEDIA